ncbi:MAG: ABC transporter permease [Chloroflexi bacterium]|jgi:peptide/nickel transport system permease protein|nr:MAG: binding-protein-dependent transport system inner membrane protein [Chloroflexi bacterium OLB13]MBC6956810.1 ABC transporter permease [Chloroflexota bacterium]MBV6437970.1 Oligopeptide transport system permease protein OppC [Anaerolineae bacterium]MDL1915898.1 ABC transporter permease [Anaerolineae bacterium CFX4]OQY81556.1 MAG: hypothetical protein B6D42_10950 [Anaerolineae bacterium UTCFX5]
MANAAAKQAQTVVTLGEREPEAESLLKIAVRRFFKHRMAVAGLVIMAAILLYTIGGAFFVSEEFANDADVTQRFEAPSAAHPFGTDEVGRDLLARTIYGGQISLAIGLISVTIAISIGTVVGLVSGYFGGLVDSILMRFVEAMLAIPTLILLLLLQRPLIEASATNIVIFGRQISVTVVAIILIIGLTSWLGLSRIVRSLVLTLKEQEFITAAHMLGASNWRIIFVHILPNCLAPILVSATLGIGGAIVVETALSFLGFGVLPPTATWGNILQRARVDPYEYPWMWMAPGALITLTVLSINFIGDGLRDAFDPRSMKGG